MRRVPIVPADRFRLFVVVTNVFPDPARQVGDGREDAAGQQIALDLGEPEFHLVQPRRVGGREVQPHLLMCDQECAHRFVLMRRQIVEDDVNFVRPRGPGTTSDRNATNASLVWRGTV